MESADVLSVVVVVLLVAALWAAIPGLLAGWMLREHGRSYSTGFALGAVCGPVGLLAALALIFFDDRAAAARAATRRRAFRLHYTVPVVGQLHASTVWMLAGVAAFLCTWALGALLYTLYQGYTPATPDDARAGSQPAATQPQTAARADNAASAPQPQTVQPAAAANASALQPQQQRVTPGAPQAPALQAGASPSANFDSGAGGQNQPPPSDAGDGPAQQQGPSQTAAAPPPPQAQPRAESVIAAPPKAPARAAVISELTQSLAARGHRGVHPAVSGDAGSATLTLSGATLTREAGAQLLGNRGTRDALKGAGVRVVVLLNGRESWTFML